MRRRTIALLVTAMVSAALAIVSPAATRAGASAGLITGSLGLNNKGQLGDGTTVDKNKPVPVLAGEVAPEFTAVSGGYDHSLGLTPEGRVAAWGDNTYGQLGTGNFTASATPVLVPGLTNVTAISAGAYHSLARKSDGSVVAWGYNAQGQIGDATTTTRNTPTAVTGITTATAIDAGGYHSLAVLANGTVRSWGFNGNGALGDGSTTNRSTPVTVSGLGSVTQVAGGGAFSLARHSGGTVSAWGANVEGQLGDGTITQRLTPVTVTSLSNVTKVAAGYAHSIAMRGDGTVAAWGDNFYGQVGDGTFSDRGTPVNLPGAQNIIGISAGDYHSMAWSDAGLVWGSNAFGQLGAPLTSLYVTQPTFTNNFVTLNGIVAADGGAQHTLVATTPALLRVVSSPPVPTQIRIDGVIADTYGVSYVKMLPGPHTVSYDRVEGFTTPPPETYVLATGEATTLTGTFTPRGYLRVLTSPATPGTIYVDGSPRQDWGMWTDIPTGSHTVCFGPVPGLTTPACQTVSVTAGGTTTVTGTYAGGGPSNVGGLAGTFGVNTGQQLGDASAGSFRSVAGAVNAGTVAPVFTAISAADHGLGVTPQGTVAAWGFNGNGQLGDGTKTARSAPIIVPGVTNVVAVAAGLRHSLALKADGTVMSWGANGDGQLGDGTTTERLTPLTIPGLSNVVAIDAGGGFSMALRADGSVMAWGDNQQGALGDATVVDRSTPVQVLLPGRVAAIAAGAVHALARTSAGQVYGWGSNDYGQVGDGSGLDQSIPKATSVTDAIDIDAGDFHSVAVRANGTAAAWGNGEIGQLGRGSASNSLVPVAVNAPAVGLVDVSAGGHSVVARTTDGTLVSWGSNVDGQLGDATNDTRDSPVVVVGVSGVQSFAVGVAHTLFLATPSVLRVVSDPSVPTQISLDNNLADNFGIAFVKLLPARHNVSFGRVEGYGTPSPIALTAPGGVAVQVTGTFTPQGSLRVLTSPATPATIYVDGTPRQDWGMWTDIPAGTHRVCFGTVAGLTSPACQDVVVATSGLTTVTGVFT